MDTLANNIKNGDEQAFRSFFDQTYAHVMAYLSKVLYSNSFAEDVAQEAYILYTAIVVDAATGYNGTAEFSVNNGLDPYNGWPLSDPSVLEAKPGRLTIVKTTVFPYNDGIQDYDMYSIELLLEY